MICVGITHNRGVDQCVLTRVNVLSIRAPDETHHVYANGPESQVKHSRRDICVSTADCIGSEGGKY